MRESFFFFFLEVVQTYSQRLGSNLTAVCIFSSQTPVSLFSYLNMM